MTQAKFAKCMKFLHSFPLQVFRIYICNSLALTTPPPKNMISQHCGKWGMVVSSAGGYLNFRQVEDNIQCKLQNFIQGSIMTTPSVHSLCKPYLAGFTKGLGIMSATRLSLNSCGVVLSTFSHRVQKMMKSRDHDPYSQDFHMVVEKYPATHPLKSYSMGVVKDFTRFSTYFSCCHYYW